jgi:integrase
MSRNGWIEDRRDRKTKDGKPMGGARWRAKYRTPDGRTRSKSFPTKVEAERWLDSQKVARDRGEWVDPNAGKVLFGDYADEVAEGRAHLAATTRERDRSYMANLVLPQLGKLPLSAVTPGHLRKMVASLSAEGYAPATVRKAYQLAALVLSQAVLDDKLARTPARGVDLPSDRNSREPGTESEIRVLDPSQVAALHEAIDPRYRVAVSLGAFAGLRLGEALGLQVQSLDLLRRRLTVAATLTNLNGSVSLGPPKTKASRRTLALPAFLAEELAAHLATFGTGPEGVVLSSPKGSWVRASSWRRRFWHPAIESSGVGRPFRYHELRHTHASWLIEQGAHAKAIQTRLGHSSIVVTMDTYGHLMPGMDEALAEGLGVLAVTAETPALGQVVGLG